MFKVNDQDTRATSLTLNFEQILPVGLSMVGFKQVHGGWEACQTNEINQHYRIHESISSTGPFKTFPIKSVQQASACLKLLINVVDYAIVT